MRSIRALTMIVLGLISLFWVVGLSYARTAKKHFFNGLIYATQGRSEETKAGI